MVGDANVDDANERPPLPSDTLIADRIEIADLLTRFALLLDEQRWEDASTVFTDDVAVSGPRGELHGIDQLVDLLRGAEVEGEHHQHLTTDLLVDVDGGGDSAAASANSLVYFYRDGQPPHRTSGLRLDCTAVRTPAGWRLRESRTTLAWMREE